MAEYKSFSENTEHEENMNTTALLMSKEADGVRYQKIKELLSEPAVKPIDRNRGKDIYLVFDFDYDKRKVSVRNSFKIKDILKSKGFYFEPEKKAWTGDIFRLISVSEQIWEYIPINVRYYLWSNGCNNKYTQKIKEKIEAEYKKENKSTVVLESNTEKIFNECMNYINSKYKDDYLYPYQRIGVERIVKALLSKHHGFILEDEQGLGKTLQALIFVALLKDVIDPDATVVYFTKNALVPQVYQEAVEHLPQTVKEKINIAHSLVIEGKINIISYTKLISPKVYPLLTTARYDYVILDECHVLKSTKAKTVKNIKKLLVHSKFILAMTGTLIKNRPADAYNILKFTKLYDKNLAQFILQFEGEEFFLQFFQRTK